MNQDLELLQQQIKNYNKLYREGHPAILDQQFDDLLEDLEKRLDSEEYSKFRDSLHEVSGKIKHPFVMGSLDKLKYEEPDKVLKFLRDKVNSRMLNVSAKIDGISCRTTYIGGKLVSCTSRGNGEFGESFNDKMQFIKNVPQCIDVVDKPGAYGYVRDFNELHIRGELVILKSDFDKVSDRFANARNACAGIMNRKDWDKDDISLITFVPYAILGGKFTKNEQFEILEAFGFDVAWHTTLKLNGCDNVVEKLFEFANQDFSYDTDGLVLSDVNYYNEKKYRPDNQVAFKINQLQGETMLIDIDWGKPSKNGKLCPVAILEPIELGGSVISRATCYNAQYILDSKLKYGSRILLSKSGDVIPKIIKKLDDLSDSTEIDIPKTCPVCGNDLLWDGVDIRCFNKDCGGRKSKEATQFIVKLGIKHVSEKTLLNNNLDSIQKIVSWKLTGKETPSIVKFYNDLQEVMYHSSLKKLLSCCNIANIADKTFDKIWPVIESEFESIDDTLSIRVFKTLNNAIIDGVGDATKKSFIEDFDEALLNVRQIVLDQRWKPLVEKKVSIKTSGVSVCFTGALKKMGRSSASKLAKDAGIEVLNVVNKKLTYLVTNDTTSGSSKNVKAAQLGVKIINEEEFYKLVDRLSNVNSVDDSLEEL